MRMTNKIMQNNSLYNINNNKILQDKLSTQMSTQKKLTRPSDDPVVAIRALRLRTTVTELTQYYEKNVPDAESWIEVTEDALNTTTEVLTDLIKQATKAANKDYGTEDLQIILEQMKSLRDEFYATGNVDYAGRYIFTGYRTDTTLTFTSDVEEQADGYPSYQITEQNTISDFDVINYTNIGNLEGLNKNNYTDSSYDDIVEQDIVNGDIYRMRLSYDSLDSATDLTITLSGVDASDYDPDNADDAAALEALTFSAVTVSSSDDPYSQMLEANENGEDLIIFVPETGEVLFSDTAYSRMEAAVKSLDGTSTEIQFTYTKNQWKEGDLRPEHYFACTGTTLNDDGSTKVVNYNQDYLTGTSSKQVIEYDVGYNQTIQVNTTADEVFGHDLDRDIDDLEIAIANLADIDAIMTDLETVLNGLEEGTAEYEDAMLKYEAAEKAYSYIRENVQSLMESAITKFQGYLDDTNVAITDNGTRSQRLSLISNRLLDQQTTFKTLQSENEDIDIAEVVVQLTSAELTYEAALMATGKVMQTSLMNYI